jgi:hypothetical protein
VAVYKTSNSGLLTKREYTSFLAGNEQFGQPIYESIATITVGSGGSATVTFSSIPSTYTHLQIRCISKDSRSNPNTAMSVRFNNDSGANYSTHDLTGDGGSASASAGSSTTEFGIGNTSGGSNANIFGAQIVDILDYANTNKFKTVRTLGGHDQNGSGYLGLFSGNWRSATAINSITIIPLVANIQQYSSFALYGIK